MDTTVAFVFLWISVEAKVGKYIYIDSLMTWYDAQTYCRQHHIDLAYVGSQSDQYSLREAGADLLYVIGWIGLHRTSEDSSTWIWSGGSEMTYDNWGYFQPDMGSQISVYININRRWHDNDPANPFYFYCFDIHVVEMKTSWEGALSHCRMNQKDLPSIVSESEHLLAQRAIPANITDPVWIGLRYLSDGWLWVNNDPLVYKNWTQGGDQDNQCPRHKRCGALTKDNGWENRDCREKLNFICV